MYKYQTDPESVYLFEAYSLCIKQSSDFLTHNSESELKKYYKYPYFCCSSDQSEFSNYMHCLCCKVERWLFEQGLFTKFYYTIPEQMNDIFYNLKPLPHEKDTAPWKRLKQIEANQRETMLVIVRILTTILGEGILPMIISR